MTDLEERLRGLRHPVADGPTASKLRDCATRRLRHRHVTVLAAAVIVVATAAAGLVWTSLSDAPGNQVAVRPDLDKDLDEPTRTIGQVEGVTATVSPRDGIRDGDVVEVRIDGLDTLPDASILLCAGDVTASDAASACDPSSVLQPNSDAQHPVEAVEGTQNVSLARIIRIARGAPDPSEPLDYDCATESAGCVLAIGPYDAPVRAVLVPVSFDDEPVADPTASVGQDQGLTDGQEVTLVARDLSPNRTVDIRLCQVSPGEKCDEIDPFISAESDKDGTVETTVPIHAALYGWQGAVDCTHQRCAVVINDRGRRLAEVPVNFATGVTAPVPRLELDPPGPYAEGQQVTVHGSGFRPGLDIGGQLGQCPADLDTAVQERCAYSLFGLTVESDGTFTATFTPERSLLFTGSCVDEPGCLLAWVIPHGPIGASAPLPLAP
jgi:hypothetical protein